MAIADVDGVEIFIVAVAVAVAAPRGIAENSFNV